MAKASKFESDDRRLREMGHDPDVMTIRQRIEALSGLPVSQIHVTRQDEGVSEPSGARKRTSVRKRAENVQESAQSGPEWHPAGDSCVQGRLFE